MPEREIILSFYFSVMLVTHEFKIQEAKQVDRALSETHVLSLLAPEQTTRDSTHHKSLGSQITYASEEMQSLSKRNLFSLQHEEYVLNLGKG